MVYDVNEFVDIGEKARGIEVRLHNTTLDRVVTAIAAMRTIIALRESLKMIDVRAHPLLDFHLVTVTAVDVHVTPAIRIEVNAEVRKRTGQKREEFVDFTLFAEKLRFVSVIATSEILVVDD